jgi:3',5'-cyclic AMP phosphodiesterase CpdA
MRILVHLSDLHFGTVDPGLVQPLIEAVRGLSPDVVVVSGDLTQRARSAQFMEARAFLEALPKPRIVVPGNHDVPLWNVYARFFTPLEKYRRHISKNLEPFHRDEEIAVLGLNTARSLTIKNGRINREQLQTLKARFGTVEPGVIRILATHHPFDLPLGFDAEGLVGRAERSMQALAECRIDLLLAGHLHVSHTGHTFERYRIAGHSALAISAGTALSQRRRGESNAFNVLRIAGTRVSLARCIWRETQGRYMESGAELFERGPDGWQRARTAEPE